MFQLGKVIAMVLAVLAQQAAEDKDFKPLGEISGTDTTIERQSTILVTDQKQFEAVWQDHKGLVGGSNSGILESQVPAVDFKKNVVFALFAGQTNGVESYSIVDVNTKGKTNIVRFKANQFPAGLALISSSYAMWVFPRPNKPVEFEFITGYEGNKPITQKVARFEPPKKPKAQNDPKINGGS